MITVYIRRYFDAAHYLPHYPGKCANLHGHRWTVEVGVSGPLNHETGMIIDFAVLKQLVDEYVGRWDHSNLNNFFTNPTAEIIARDLFHELSVKVNTDYPDYEHRNTRMKVVKLWETPDNFVEVTP